LGNDVAQGDGRDPNGRFAQGNPGGPGGSRRRALEVRRAAQEAISPEYIQAMIRKATRMGLEEGNLAAMRMVFEQTVGRPAEAPSEPSPLGIPIPRLLTAADCNLANERIVEGLTNGCVDHGVAMILIKAIQTRIKTLEVAEIEDRVARLEAKAGTVLLPHGRL
jgi:hypothetical protein